MSVDLAKRLFEQRNKLLGESRAITDIADKEKRDLTAEERGKYETIDTDIAAHDVRMHAVLDAMARDKAADETFRTLNAKPESAPIVPEGESLRSLMAANKSVELRAADGSLGTMGWRRLQEAPESRALSKGTASAGGNTVKTSFYDRLIDHLIEVSGIMMAGPTVLNTDSGEDIQIATTTAHSSAVIVAEAAAIGASDPVFAQRTLKAYKYGILLQLSSELITDTSVDLEGYLAMELGRALGNGFGAHAITGSGSGQPTGVVTSATAGVTGATSVVGAFTADNLIDLMFSVIAPYRNSPSCHWMLKDSTLGAVRKLKDTAGYYLFSPAATMGAPDTLLGKPIVTDPNVAAPALGAKSVIFGDFSRYFVRLVNGIRLERSIDYAFNTDQTTWRALLRADGITVDQTGALKYFVGGAS